MKFFICLFAQALLIPVTMFVIMVIAVFFRVPAVENPCIRMFADTRHNGWMVVVGLWAFVWTIVGWNYPAFVSPLESFNSGALLEVVADDRDTAVERLNQVTGFFQIGSLIDWANPADEAPRESTWRGSAAVASWVILIISGLWVFSDDATAALIRPWKALLQRNTSTATWTSGPVDPLNTKRNPVFTLIGAAFAVAIGYILGSRKKSS